MALISRIPVADVAAVVARALEELLGHDVALSTGTPELGEPRDDVLPAGATHTVVLPFTDGYVGEVSLVVGEHFATALEAITPDASLTTAALPALEAGASAITFTLDIPVNPADAGEISTETLLTSVVGEFAAVPILENDVRVACVVVRIVDDEPYEDAHAFAPQPEVAGAPNAAPFDPPIATHAAHAPDAGFGAVPAPAPIAAPFDPPAAPLVPVPAAAPAPAGEVPVAAPAHGIAVHEFQPLGAGQGGEAPLRPLTLLNDVNMEITAELGRGRLKVRDIVALRPGGVIELDRAAGSPVDVLVNGALVWHGEVVVVDDEFGIRVSEIVTDEA